MFTKRKKRDEQVKIGFYFSARLLKIEEFKSKFQNEQMETNQAELMTNIYRVNDVDVRCFFSFQIVQFNLNLTVFFKSTIYSPRTKREISMTDI